MTTPDTLPRETLRERVSEARTAMEAAEARLRDKAERGEEPTPLDHAHLKVARDTYFHGVKLLRERES